MPLTVSLPNGDGKPQTSRSTPTRARARTPTLAALAKLKPAFAAGGIVTAGNASQMSDGAAAAVVMSRGAGEGAGPQAAARASSPTRSRACRPEIMGIGPVEAIPKALQAGRA